MGVDSSTQSCKVVVRDTDTNQVVRASSAPHPPGTEVDPQAWWEALWEAITQAGGLGDIAAISIAGQQHGLVTLDEAGAVVRPALLWNDTRSSQEAEDLIARFGAGPLVERTGSLPVAALTSSKLLWVSRHEPDHAKRIAAVCLPHDYLSWRLSDSYPDISGLFTDRSDASGTGYFNPVTNTYDDEILQFCLNHTITVPRIVPVGEPAGKVSAEYAHHQPPIGSGMGDNAAAARGMGLAPGTLAVSLGTSGTVFGVSDSPSRDDRGYISGFASAEGSYLPLVCTLNAARVLTWGASLLGVDVDEFSDLALQAPDGAGGLVVLPYLEGERTPNLPDATASLTGITLSSGTRENFARACIEGMLRNLVDASGHLEEAGHPMERVVLIGGAAASPAVRKVASELFRVPLEVAEPAEYVALGASRQAEDVLQIDLSLKPGRSDP